MDCNNNKIYDRLCLKNVPISMTKDQIVSAFFKDLDNVKIFFSKHLVQKRMVFVQLNSKNEGKLCMQLINRLGYQNIEASFADCQTTPKSSDESTGVQDLRKCKYCGKENSEYLCSGCNTLYYAAYYCTKDHQERDWIKHKNECKALPQLIRCNVATDEKESTGNNIQSKAKHVENDSTKRAKYHIRVNDSGISKGSKVMISAVCSSRVIYVHQISEKYDELILTVEKNSSIASFLTESPILNEYVFAPYKNSFHRAKILDELSTDNDGCNFKVVLIDIGVELKVRWQDCKNLNFKTRALQTLTQKVILNDVKDDGRNEAVKNYLKKLCTEKTELEIVEIFGTQNTGKKVVLQHVETRQIVNQVINQLATTENQRIFNFDLTKIPKFSTKAAVKIFVADYSQFEGKNLLSCIPNEKFLDYLHMMEDLKIYCARMSNEPYFDLKLHEICLVKYNNQWCRACYMNQETNNNYNSQLRFVLIDLMIEVMISKKDVRKISKTLSKDYYTSLCAVEELNKTKMKKIKDKIKCKFINANVKYSEEWPILYNLNID